MMANNKNSVEAHYTRGGLGEGMRSRPLSESDDDGSGGRRSSASRGVSGLTQGFPDGKLDVYPGFPGWDGRGLPGRL